MAGISTSSEGLVAGWVTVPAGDVDIPAYRAMPASGKAFATVLVVQEIFGVHEYIQDVCRRLAHEGYFAVAGEMFARQGDVSQIVEHSAITARVVSKVTDAQVMSDLDALADWTRSTGKADGTRLGITGFCWGGRAVWLYAAHSDRLKAGVAWYGRLTGEPTGLTPEHPLQAVKRLRAPVLGLYAGLDRGIALADVAQMRAALEHANKTDCELIVYPEAGHGFHADYRPSYRREDAEDGWRRMLEFFRKHGI